ncbi:MAG: hypothetical protein ACYDIA_09925 [Candidatus Humimicrobiaceae bacterium]
MAQYIQGGNSAWQDSLSKLKPKTGGAVVYGSAYKPIAPKTTITPPQQQVIPPAPQQTYEIRWGFKLGHLHKNQ